MSLVEPRIIIHNDNIPWTILPVFFPLGQYRQPHTKYYSLFGMVCYIFYTKVGKIFKAVWACPVKAEDAARGYSRHKGRTMPEQLPR